MTCCWDNSPTFCSYRSTPPRFPESSDREEAAPPAEREPEDSKHLPDRPDGLGAGALYGSKAMKSKKREFLKKRKQRKRAKGGGEEEGEGSLEASVMTDRHKPAFGEQAMQPLRVSITFDALAGE